MHSELLTVHYVQLWVQFLFFLHLLSAFMKVGEKKNGHVKSGTGPSISESHE